MHLAQAAEVEKAEFFKIIKEQQESDERDKKIQNYRMEAFKQYKCDIQSQIEKNTEVKR